METVVTSPPRSRTSWGAIFAGVVVALATQVLFVMLGLAVGAAAIDASASNPFAGIGVGSLIWLALSGIVSLFAGGYVSGRLSSSPDRGEGALNGLVVWALFLVVSLFVAGSGVAGVVGGALSVAKSGGQAAAGRGGGIVEDVLARSELTQTPQGQAAQKPLTNEQRQTAQVIAKNTGLTQQQAENLVRNTNAAATSPQASRQAQQVGASVATYSSAALFGMVIFFVLLAVASVLGGRTGVPEVRVVAA
jgi:hypothetical protein